MNFNVVIPARFASTRLPRKVLLDIAGKSMLEHVYDKAVASGAGQVVIATDHPDVEGVARAFGAEVLMTAGDHPSGTDRLAEVVTGMAWGAQQIVVNLQGDEPLMPPEVIRQVARNLDEHPPASVATVCKRITMAGELFDPHAVKVVMDREGYALYFSRATIPWDRDAFAVTTDALPEGACHYRHIGLYAYRAGFVQRYVQWPRCELERMESLEQLRVLWRGERIHVAEAAVATPPGVDTERDLARVRRILEESV